MLAAAVWCRPAACGSNACSVQAVRANCRRRWPASAAAMMRGRPGWSEGSSHSGRRVACQLGLSLHQLLQALWHKASDRGAQRSRPIVALMHAVYGVPCARLCSRVSMYSSQCLSGCKRNSLYAHQSIALGLCREAKKWWGMQHGRSKTASAAAPVRLPFHLPHCPLPHLPARA